MDDTRKRQYQFSAAYLLLALGALVLIQTIVTRRGAPRSVPMSDFQAAVRSGQVSEVFIREKDFLAQLRPPAPERKGERLVATRLPGMDETALVREMQERGIRFSGVIQQESRTETLVFSWLLPVGVLVGIWFFVMRRLQGRGGPLSIGRSKAKIYDEAEHGKVSFDDVAGALTEDEKRRVAYHEAGHALVALSVDHANRVHRVTIIPRSIGALGVTQHLRARQILDERRQVLERMTRRLLEIETLDRAAIDALLSEGETAAVVVT